MEKIRGKERGVSFCISLQPLKGKFLPPIVEITLAITSLFVVIEPSAFLVVTSADAEAD